MSACRRPCASCPWRTSAHADAIPNFDLEKAEALDRTTSDQFGAPLFQCHQSTNEKPVICAGWLARYGWDSISVRLQLMDGRVSPEQLEIGPDWPELHETFQQVIEKLREDVRS